MKTFKINEKTYTAVPFNFNTVCELEDAGVALQDIAKKPMGFVRGYIAVCAGLSLEEASKEIEAHLMSGGTLDTVSNIIADEVEKSDFFRSLTQTTTKKTTAKEA